MNSSMTKAGLAAGVAALALLAGCGKTDKAADKPLASGIELANFDKSVRPQDDLFRHVNGNWLKTTEIPADKARYGSFTKLRDDSEARLRTIIEESAAKPNKKAGSDEQKVGDLYASFMDEAKLEELGIKPLEAELARIDALKGKQEIAALLARFARMNVGTPINGYVNQDDKDPTQYIFYVLQSGLGLPDRDYYLLPDAKFKEARVAYEAHVARTLELAGDKAAANSAKAVMALETAMAKSHWSRVDSRDADKTYNKFELAKINELTPGFDFAAALKELGVTNGAVIVSQPSAYTGFAEQVKAQSLDTWKAYLRFQLLRSASPYLSKAFVDENFAFYGKTLRGVQELRPRWKRAVAAVEGSLGESLGKIYVERHFPPEAKRRMDALVANLVKAYEQSIKSLDWMSEETKKQALVKLARFTPKIGYPNKWRDYSSLSIVNGDLLGNLMRAAEAEHVYHLSKLGKPIDRDEWFMTPQTVNAYYNANLNEIVFPAAILQPPFFNLDAEDAVNYGGIGAVIGHEIGHGFDDQGSKYDGDGRLQSWWTDEDRRKFEERTKALIGQYDQFEPLPGQKVNGALTIGENIGDLGGATIAHLAYKLSLNGKPAPVLDGYTGDQRFFIGFAQVWRDKMRDQAQLENLKTDPHSPPEFRCNGTVVNVPEFYVAFDVKEGDKLFLAPEKRVKIW
ncbi:MAG TPA: M13-type metalloendopeptidase [Verrucomicrobiae bacterium]|nr:M13-type metalloendopeptidase [Verrucomicrobiae bacterium]